MNSLDVPTKKNMAVIGGGLMGLSAAYAMVQPMAGGGDKPAVTLYDQGSEAGYSQLQDVGHRASQGASAARCVRLSGAAAGLGEWNVRQTIAMITAVQADMVANPEDYPAYDGKPLLYPEASVILGSSENPAAVEKTAKSLQDAGASHNIISGAELKLRFPGLYKTTPDDAVAVVEEPGGGAFTMDATRVLQALTHYLKKRGVMFEYGAALESVEEKGNNIDLKFAGKDGLSFDHAIIAPGQWLEMIKHENGGSLTAHYGIHPRHDRVLVMEIDAQAIGITSPAIPFSKGFAPKGGEGALYRFDPASADRIKFMPASCTYAVDSLEDLHKPINEEEKARAFKAAALRFGVDEALLKQHTQFSGCTYTCPKIEEKVLISPLGEHMTFMGLDSSGAARSAGGFGQIAAHLALGEPEPHKGAYEAFSLAGHHAQVSEGVIISLEAEVRARQVPHLVQGRGGII